MKSQQSYLTMKLSFLFSLLLILSAGCGKDEDEGDSRKEMIMGIIEDISADSIQSHIEWLQGMGTRFMLAGNQSDVANSIRNRFIRMGYRDAKLDTFHVTRFYRDIEYRTVQYNVIAMLTGSEYPDSLCILGGHYDNILSSGDPFTEAPGANDNASGTAAVIEVARVLKKNNFKPSKTIMFIAFGAEELGLYGSHDFASDPGEFAGKISFMLNNDMIAYEPDDNPASWQVNILDYDNSHSLRAEAEDIIKYYTRLGYMNDNTYNRYSDSYPFALNGYKALFFTSLKMDPEYHTLNDLSSNCNFDYCSEIVKISCAILAEKNYRNN